MTDAWICRCQKCRFKSENWALKPAVLRKLRQRRDNTLSPVYNPVKCWPRGPAGAWFTPGFKLILTMSLTSIDITNIANLARLELQPDESERLLAKINGFFDLVEKMRSVDTGGITPLAHPFDANRINIPHMALRLRDDVVSEPNNREANQQNAPAIERGLFLVPKVIE